MGMLTRDDLKQIGRLLDEKNAVLKVELKEEITSEVTEKVTSRVTENVVSQVTENVVSQVGEMIEQNILPHFDKIYDRFDRLERRVDRVDGKVNALTNVLLAKRVINEDDKRQALA